MNKKSPIVNCLIVSPLVIVLFSCILASCKKDSSGSSVGANVRLLVNNLSPDAYPVILYSNGVPQNPLTTNITNTALSNYTKYVYNTPSAYFTLKSTDSAPQLRSTKTVDSILVRISETFGADTSYSVFLVGLLSNNSLGYILTTDTASTSTVGTSKIRYVNASLGTTTGYDVYANGVLAFNNVKYKSISKYIELPAGIYDFKFVSTGNKVNTSSNILIDVPSVTIGDGHLYTLYSCGVTGRADSAALAAAVITNR